jgi:hypothetical protein
MDERLSPVEEDNDDDEEETKVDCCMAELAEEDDDNDDEEVDVLDVEDAELEVSAVVDDAF